MLRVFGSGAQDCDGITRRSFLQAGMLGVGGLALPELLRLRAAGATDVGVSKRSVILFWLSGGPGHMETWDPKPDAPRGFRGPFGAIPTSVPGVQFGELLPEQARRMDRLAILRTVNHGTGDHTKGNHWMLTGYEGPGVQRPRQRSSAPAGHGCGGGPDQGPGADQACLLTSRCPTSGAGPTTCSTMRPTSAAPPTRSSSSPTPTTRSTSSSTCGRPEAFRSTGWKTAATCSRRWTPCAGRPIPGFATSTLTTSAPSPCSRAETVATAFDINAEDPKLRDRYGRHTFGQSALLARRLVEAGTTFVTVNCVPWDHHGTEPQLTTEDGARKLIPPLDRAIGALIDDLIDRGLYESTLVVAMGEFGRTPRMNKDAGRDHWGNTFSVLMGCGSMRMGQVIGRSSAKGEHVVDRPISPQDVAATVYHHLGIDSRSITFEDRAGRPTYLIDKGEPIRELVG